MIRRGLIAGLALATASALAQEGAEPAPQSPPAEEASAAGTGTTPEAAAPADGAAQPETVTVPLAAEEEEQSARKSRNVTELETIEVTAEKRVKAQRDIPGSVGAIRGQDLEAMRAQGMKDYFKLIPGVLYADQGNEESYPVIRGITTGIYSFGALSGSTGVYMEEMPFADLFGSASIPDLNPFDLDRVEVLKGPQGTLFGSGSLAGAVRYLVQKPEFSLWQGKAMSTVSRTVGSDGLAKVNAAALNVPVGDDLAFRIVGLQRDEPGLYDMSAHDSNGNTLRDDKDADRGRQQSARVLGAWKPLDDLEVSAFYFGQRTHSDDNSWADQTQTLSSGLNPFASPRDHEFGGGNLLVTYAAPWFQVLSSTNRMTKHNYQDNHGEYGFDLGQQNQSEYQAVFRDDVDGYTQEFRLTSLPGGGWDWLVGAMRMSFGDKFFQYSFIGPDRPDPTSQDQISQADKASSFLFAGADQDAIETAFFGETTGRLGEYWEVTLGGRRYTTQLVADTETCGQQITALFQMPCVYDHIDTTESGLNPKASIRYLHNRNVQLYVLASKGFQFGGVQPNPAAPGFSDSAQRAGYSFQPYKSSVLWNYELGVRTEWLDRRLRFDLSFFYLDWKDLQLQVRIPLFPTSATFLIVGNVGRAHSEGVEAAFDVLPFAGAHWTTSLTMMNAVTDELFDPNGADGGVKPGTRLPGAPHFQWSNVASYEHDLPWFSGWTFGPTLTHAYSGPATDEIRARGTIGGYSTLDARLVLANPASRFQPEISVGVNNLTDARGPAFHLSVDDAVQSGVVHDFWHFAQPRTTVLSVSLRY